MTSKYISTESIRSRTRDDFFNRGVVYSEFDIMRMRAKFESEASPCTTCHMMVHPDMLERHNQKHHPIEIVKLSIPTEPVIIDTSTKFHVGQQVRIAGTSHTLPVKEVKTLDKTWYRFDITAGAVKHQWFAEDRLTALEAQEPQTISPERVTRCAEGIKYPLALPNCMAIVLYQAA